MKKSLSEEVQEKGLFIGFYCIRKGDPPPLFALNPANAEHIELLKVPEKNRGGVYMLAIWPDKTTYLAWWGNKDSLIRHLAKAGVVVAKMMDEKRKWSPKLEKKYLKDAKQRPEYRNAN